MALKVPRVTFPSPLITGLVIGIIIVLSFNLFLLVSMRQQQIQAEATITSLRAEIGRQRNDKNTIRSLWEEQAALNDRLVISHENVISRYRSYVAEVGRTIRFVNGIAEVLPTADESRLTDTNRLVNQEIEATNEIIEDNANKKQAAKDKIDALYLNAREQQENRANPRN